MGEKLAVWKFLSILTSPLISLRMKNFMPVVDEKVASTSRDDRIFRSDQNFARDTVPAAAVVIGASGSPATPSLNLVRRHPNFFSFSAVGGFSGASSANSNTSANMDNNNGKVSRNSQDGTNCLGAAALIHNAQQRNFFTRQDSMDHSSSTSRRYSPFVRGGTAKSRFLMSAGASNLASVQSRPDSPAGETPPSSAGMAPSAVVRTPTPPKPPILLNKQKLLALAPPSLHISFECTEQSKNQRHDHMSNLAGSLSSDNIR
uniref:Uncharacterized protein n=1 Tax=Romanomermis culicivorax TaxID=13658 RepID=A0A915HVM5_ROMCU